MSTIFRFQFLILIIVAISFATFGFASSQTGGPTGGEGANLVSGYTVSSVHYQLAGDSSKLVAVEFDLNASAEIVKASVNTSTGEFFICQNAGAYHWVCNINSSVNVSDVNELKVIATSG